MAVKIRLARGGSKKRPFYSIVAADSRQARDGRFMEKLGTYNPLLAKDDENRVQMNVERSSWNSSASAHSRPIVFAASSKLPVRWKRKPAPT